jgi:predicted lipoprotein with Yx(FWY)xxD motif
MKTTSGVKLFAGLAVAASLSVATTASATASAAATAGPGAPSHATAPSKVLTGGVEVINVTKYGSVLGDRSGHTLYLLTTESGSKLHCLSAACLATWPPLEITKGQKVGIGTGVKGKVSTVARSSTVLQVTFNGYPVYTG